MRNYYEVLGVPRGASISQIKRKYRMLVHKYHPDVAGDKEQAHKIFIQINLAYDTLIDPVKRKEYDAKLAPPAPPRQEPVYNQPKYAAASKAPQEVQKLIKQAQWLFIQRRFTEAARRCNDAINIDKRNAQAYSILGDVYRAQSKPNAAVKAYSYAVQFNPRDTETERKLTDLLSKQIGNNPQYVKGPSVKPSLKKYNILWWLLVFLPIILIGKYPGEPMERLLGLPIAGFSWNLIGFIALASFILGSLFSINGLVDNLDEELILGSGGSVIPTGLLLLIGSIVFFPVAAFLYIIIEFIQDSISKSVMIIFAGVVGVVLLSAISYEPNAIYGPDIKMHVILFGGNISFALMVIGWFVGGLLHGLEEPF